MDFDINKILNIPKCKEYENNALRKWLDYLEYDGVKIDEKELIERFKEEKEMKFKVKAIINFTDLEEDKKRVIGDEFICEKERADFLLEHKAIEILEEVKEKGSKVKPEIKIDEEKIEVFEEKPKKKKSSKK